MASDASSPGFGVCRTSSLEPSGLLALAVLQRNHNFRGEEIGLIEVGTTRGGVRQAFARLKVRPGAYATVGAREESKRIILQTGPDAMISDASAELNETELKDLLNRASRSKKWLVAGTDCEFCFLLTTACLIQKIASTLRHAMSEFNVETLLESRNSLSKARWVSVSKLYQMKPIAFRCTSESTTHDEEFFWVSWKIKANELGKCARDVEVDWIEVQSEDFAPLTITRKELSLGFPSDYTLPYLPTSAVKTRPKELESMRWSILASTGHPKHAAALVKS